MQLIIIRFITWYDCVEPRALDKESGGMVRVCALTTGRTGQPTDLFPSTTVPHRAPRYLQPILREPPHPDCLHLYSIPCSLHALLTPALLAAIQTCLLICWWLFCAIYLKFLTI